MDGVLPSIIRVNKRAYSGWETAQANAVRWGQLVQDNALLHELGHYIDFCNDPDNYRKLEHNWNLENMDKDLIKKHLSSYATSDYAEFEAELNAAIMRGKVLPKELLSYSHMNKVDTELAKSLLSLGAGETVCLPSEEISKGFKDTMKVLFNQKGSSFSIDIMADKNVQSLIEAHATVLDRNLQRVEMSDIMRQRLQRSNYIFSGIKTFHELNEAFPSLLDENGNRKPFERFLNDVQTIDDTYNSHYLRAEYNFVQSSAQMAAKWEQFAEDGDRYNLQYRTAGDSKVRPAHAALNGVTLPPSDPFWQTYYPPNGWGCRCNVVQVRKAKYPATPHDEAMKRGEEALQDDTKGIFHFNPGIQQKAMPDYNPYTIRRCRDCDIAKGKIKLARFVPENELCAACRFLHECVGNREKTQAAILRKHYIDKEMAPLLDKKVQKQLPNGNNIKVGFDKKGNKHLYSDTMARTRRVSADELKDMDIMLDNATYLNEAAHDPTHNNPFDYFYYFKATTANGQSVRLNIGRETHRRNDGRIIVKYICYSINNINE